MGSHQDPALVDRALPTSPGSLRRKPVNGHVRRSSMQSSAGFSTASRDVETPEPDRLRDSVASITVEGAVSSRHACITSHSPAVSVAGDVLVTDDLRRRTVASELPFDELGAQEQGQPEFERPQYFHQPYHVQPSSARAPSVSADTLSPHGHLPSPGSGDYLTPSPTASPSPYARSLSASRRSPDHRPQSYVDLLNNVPYAQQVAPTQDLSQTALRGVVGGDVSLLDTQKTVEMYLANVKKTPELSVQYGFAVYLVQAAQEYGQSDDPAKRSYAETVMVREARQILQRLADRSYPFAQYLLADGYYSGFFNKLKPDQEKAFPLFVAASKHGHAESGYRAALMYEHGWGCRKDTAKAAKFYRASASKGHPGAASRLGQACIYGELGLVRQDRQGLKWLKRASEHANSQYNAGPLILATLHENGHGNDCFKDEGYAAQLYTQAAELGNAEACLKMGQCYEHGLLGCPEDPALSIHFYTGAALQDVPEAMMNLCAWYLVGAPPVLEKDENEAYEWAKRAAEMGFIKAEYAVGYFTEMGIGCRRDALEANVWYVRAAGKGYAKAKERLAAIRAAASGETGTVQLETKKKGKDDKDCVVM